MSSNRRVEPRSIPGAVVEEMQPAGNRDFITSTDALTAYTSLVTEYTTPQDTTIRRVFAVAGGRQIKLEVWGVGADNAGWQAHIYGLERLEWPGRRPAPDADSLFQPIWRPRPIASVNAKLCAYTLAADTNAKRDPLTATGLTVRASDTWEIDADYTYADTTKILHEFPDQAGAIMFDPSGCEFVVFEGSCLDPDTSANSTKIIPFMRRA